MPGTELFHFLAPLRPPSIHRTDPSLLPFACGECQKESCGSGRLYIAAVVFRLSNSAATLKEMQPQSSIIRGEDETLVIPRHHFPSEQPRCQEPAFCAWWRFPSYATQDPLVNDSAAFALEDK